MNIITKEQFFQQTAAHTTSELWAANAEERWDYHDAAARIVQTICETTPEIDVLEIGSHGVQIVEGSVTMDIPNTVWPYKATPDYTHDCRVTPWPFCQGDFDVLIALRVFQHLWPMQREAFGEACHVARNVIIAVPWEYPGDRGITEQTITEWANLCGRKCTPYAAFANTGTAVYWIHP